jgi:hypothetical protein
VEPGTPDVKAEATKVSALRRAPLLKWCDHPAPLAGQGDKDSFDSFVLFGVIVRAPLLVPWIACQGAVKSLQDFLKEADAAQCEGTSLLIVSYHPLASPSRCDSRADEPDAMPRDFSRFNAEAAKSTRQNHALRCTSRSASSVARVTKEPPYSWHSRPSRSRSLLFMSADFPAAANVSIQANTELHAFDGSQDSQNTSQCDARGLTRMRERTPRRTRHAGLGRAKRSRITLRPA